MDVDYFCFTDNLLTYTDTKYDFLVHNKVHDLTGENIIEGKVEEKKQSTFKGFAEGRSK